MTSPLLVGSLRSQLIGTGVAMVGWMAYSYLPKTVGVKYAKEKMYRSLPYFKDARSEPATAALIDEVVSDINSHQEKPVKKDGIQFFQTNMLYLSDVRHVGNSSTGAMVLLPIGIRPNADDVFHYHCNIENSLDMAEFCLISHEAKKFLIARQIFYCEDSFILFRCLLGLLLIAVASLFHYSLNSLLDMRKLVKIMKDKSKGSDFMESKRAAYTVLARRSRISSVFYIACLCVPFYKLFTAAYSVYLEDKAHRAIVNLGPEYVRGGAEYYEKVVTCNKYDYNLFGKDTKVLPNGDFYQGKYSLFHKTIPVTDKLKYFAQQSLNLRKAPQT